MKSKNNCINLRLISIQKELVFKQCIMQPQNHISLLTSHLEFSAYNFIRNPISLVLAVQAAYNLTVSSTYLLYILIEISLYYSWLPLQKYCFFSSLILIFLFMLFLFPLFYDWRSYFTHCLLQIYSLK